MATPAFTLAGVDGCKGGWIAVVADGDLKRVQIQKVTAVADLLARVPTLRIIAIDIPIGLPSRDCPLRGCDQEARRLLGPSAQSRVFFAPQRFLLGIRDYRVAVERCNTELGLGNALSIYAFAILPRIEEVDSLVRRIGQEVAREVHPELSFWSMNDHQTVESKHSQAGLDKRQVLLDHFFGPKTVVQCNRDRWGTHAKLNDLYDAFAALWSAKRILEGHSCKLPVKPEKDAEGLLMEINY